MSVHFPGEDFSPLELLPSVPLRKIVKMSNTRDLNALRLASKTLSNRREVAHKYWNLQGTISKIKNPADLKRFSSEVKVVEGLELYLDYEEPEHWPSSFSVLLEDHPELKNIFLKIGDCPTSLSLAICVQAVGHVLTRFSLNCRYLSGFYDYLKPGSLPVLEDLELNGDLNNEETAFFLCIVKSTLKKLKLSQVPILDNLFPKSCHFPALKEVEFWYCKNLIEKVIVHLLLNVKVRQLTVGSCNISGEGFEELSKLPPLLLEKLHLVHCDLITDGFCLTILKLSPNLKDLNLSHGTLITGESLTDLSLGYLHQLENLDLTDCRNITDLGLVRILRCCPELKVLKLTFSKITGEMFSELRHLHLLENLDLSGCTNLADFGLIKILKGCPGLKVLKLEGTSITGEMFSELSLNQVVDQDSKGVEKSIGAPKLEMLSLRSSLVTDAGIAAILQIVGKNLKFLNLSHTGVSGKSFSEIKLESTLLEELDVSCCYCLKVKGLTKILEKFGGKLRILNLMDKRIEEKIVKEMCFRYCPKYVQVKLQN